MALGLLLTLALVGGVVWWIEGRHETPPAEAAKQVIPYTGEQVQTVELITPDGRASFNRGADGKMEVAGPAPTPTTAPPPGATPAPVTLSPSARIESVVTQLSQLRVDRVLLNEPSASPEYGLDAPRMTFKVTPKAGQAQTLAIGELSPDKTSYYVRREEKRDTVLVSRYSLDDLIKVAEDVLKGPTSP